ncbi:acyltransferase [Microlunatus panaciterrae]|uniref:Acyltransferase 3 domain-containing protein n=1 Tax=Microlunatus panaciterrae TaxID=400768 RepID=A0ABS2RLP4_9ACTN|nr:acyltransferase [Microlunatus panaciterrae]MBM7799402.1 hypothetical protein [Microlunatus panaciterrae]
MNPAVGRGDGARVARAVHRPGRLVEVDNLRTLLVGWIIFGHALLGYMLIGGWPYDEVQEVTVPPKVELSLSVLLGPTALFVIGAFFFLAGLFAPMEMSRHGPGGFARRRLVRLGLPWVSFMLLIWPLFMWFAYLAAGRSLSLWDAFRERQPFLDAGPLWFVQVLLYVSLGYALWTRLGWGRSFRGMSVGGAQLVIVAAVMTMLSFVVRMWFPARSQQILDLHLWQWPQCVVMFCLGAMVSGQGWAARVPAKTTRNCGIAVAVTIVVMPLVALVGGVTNLSRDSVPFLGGWHWQALALDAFEASFVVAGSVGLVGLVQQRLTSVAPVPAACARGAYAAYMLQVPVLLSLEIAARPLPLPAIVKALSVGVLAVAGSFWFGWLLVSRTKLGRLL